MKLLLTLTTLLATHLCVAQKNVKDANLQEWRIIPGISNENHFPGSIIDYDPMGTSRYDFAASRVMLNDDEAAALCSIFKSGFGVVKFNSKAETKWLTPIEGLPLFMSQINDKLIVITMPGDIDNDPLSLNAIILDLHSGKQISSASIFKSKGDFKCEPKFFFDAKTNTYLIGIRETGLKNRGSSFKRNGEKEKAALTTSFRLLTLNEKGAVVNETDIAVDQTSSFLNCGIGKKDELIWITNDDNQSCTVAKFNLITRKPVTKMSVNIDASEKANMAVKYLQSTSNPDLIYIATSFNSVKKEHVSGIYKFNFGDKKVSRNETMFNKEFLRTTKDGYKQISNDTDDPSPKKWDEMQAATILETEDRIILYQEVAGNVTHVSSPSSTTTTYYTMDAIVSILDKDLKLIIHQVLPKGMSLFGSVGMGSSLKISNKKLNIIGSDAAKLLSFRMLHGVIDLQSGKTEKFATIETGIQKIDIPDPKATVWFKDGFLLSYINESGFSSRRRLRSQFQKATYN